MRHTVKHFGRKKEGEREREGERSEGKDEHGMTSSHTQNARNTSLSLPQHFQLAFNATLCSGETVFQTA